MKTEVNTLEGDAVRLPMDKALELMTEEWADAGCYTTQNVIDLANYARKLTKRLYKK